MKLFAITPGDCSAGRLIGLLPRLRERGASHVYVRTAYSDRELTDIAAASSASGIMPIVPHSRYSEKLGPCGAHFKSDEIGLLSREAPSAADFLTASGHSGADARLALEAGADYVFISPVYAPLSKDCSTELLPMAELRDLVARYGERIILLGGMTPERIRDLKESIAAAFSAAGISMFFSDAG